MAIKRILCTGLFTFLITTSLCASPGGDISGTVKGEDGAPFRAAFVRAQNIKTKMTMMVLPTIRAVRPTRCPRAPMKSGRHLLDTKRTIAANGYHGGGRQDAADFTLKKGAVQWNQLTKYQAGILLPDAKGKNVVLQECFNCHAMSRHGRDGTRSRRMAEAQSSTCARSEWPKSTKNRRSGSGLSGNSIWSGCGNSGISRTIAAISEGKAGARLFFR